MTAQASTDGDPGVPLDASPASPAAVRTRAARATRTWLGLALLLFVLSFQALSVCASLVSLSAPAAGLAYFPTASGAPRVTIASHAAAWAVGGLGSEVFARAVNGQVPVASRPYRSPFEALLDTRSGAINRFALEDGAGVRTEVAIAAEPVNLAALFMHQPEAIAFPILGLVYLGLGVFVFLRRPNDRAALPLLVFASVFAVNMSFNPMLTDFTRLLGCVREMTSPLYAPALVNLGLQFTGMHERRELKQVLRAFFALALLLAAASAYVWLLGVSPGGEQAYRAALAGLLALSVVVTASISFAAARRTRALGLRRRARVLGIATFVSFLVPSLSLLWSDLGAYWVLVVALLACFPVIVSYAIVRLGMFDIRVVLGQGLVYAVLSVGLLLGYVGLIYVAIRVLGANADRPAVLIFTMLVSVLVLSLMQLRVQGAINRIVFRSRYVLGDALSEASRRLSRARSRAEAIETARSALLDAMQLTRAAVALVEPGCTTLRCTALGGVPDPRTFEMPALLPERLAPAAFPPIARALSTLEMASAHDSEAVSAPLRDEAVTDESCSEAGFWQRFGLEWIVPMSLGPAREKDGAGAARVIGLLLLGPKLSGRSLDASDRALLATLANQLAVAIESADAFDQVRALKDNLEAQVQERTRDLSQALGDLQRMQGQLIELEKQAVVARLAAGIAHEINSPLGSLRSAVDTTGRLLTRVQPYLEAPARHGDAEAQRLLVASGEGGSLVSAMRHSGERIEALVTGLKRFVSLDQGRRRALDVCEGLDGAITLLSPALGEHVRVTRAYPPTPPRVECDPARLNQVFLSLLENAVNACANGGEIHVEVRAQRGSVRIALNDTGCGIAPERLPGLFEVGFTQKDGRVALRLGLPSSKRAIEELGGSIVLTSEEGRGTQVRIELPTAEA